MYKKINNNTTDKIYIKLNKFSNKQENMMVIPSILIGLIPGLYIRTI